MSPEIDEITLTAYALGELSGTERAAVAANLVGNAHSREYVAEVRATASLLSDELARESFGGLTDLQHAAIEQKLDEALRMPTPASARVRQRIRSDRAVLAMSLAASVVIVCGVLSALMPFIYRRVIVVAQKDTEGETRLLQFKLNRPAPDAIALPHFEGTGPVTRAHSDDLAGNETVALLPEELYVPPPDDRLAGGSGREETSAPESPLVGVRPLDVAHPMRPPQVTRGQTPDSSRDNTPPKNQAIVVRPEPPVVGKKPDAFPDSSTDQKSLTKDSSLAAAGSGNAYSHLLENPFIDVMNEPASGFAAGVDTASYSNIRRFLTHGKLPPTDAVRIEEMLNYFPVFAAVPADGGPLALQVEVGACPWKPEHRLARVCVQARSLSPVARPPANLVFVIDISPSMRSEKTKLALLKQAMHMMVGRLSAHDRVSIIAYSHEAGIVLPPTSADDKPLIRAAIDRIETGGKTNGGQGIEVAYELASQGMLPGGMNRIILATDGDWSVGATDRARLASIIREKSREGASLTVLGVGMADLKDSTLQDLASCGSGSYAYIDTLDEAKKVLADQMNGSLVTVARDVKVQVTFNSAAAAAYRLIGYERRTLSNAELKSRNKPGGELGAGQSVTALYEVIPAGGKSPATRPADLMTTTVTYIDPATLGLHTVQTAIDDRGTPLPRTSAEFRFAATVAEFGLLLRESDYKGNATYFSALEHARESAGPDDTGYRQELVALIRRARSLSKS